MYTYIHIPMSIIIDIVIIIIIIIIILMVWPSHAPPLIKRSARTVVANCFVLHACVWYPSVKEEANGNQSGRVF